MRHYKAKRDLMLRQLGKASFINGSQFVVAWISPKGEVDVFASDLLQSCVATEEGGVLNRNELKREARRIKVEVGKQWDDIKRLEKSGQAPTMEDDPAEAEDGEEAEEGDENEEAAEMMEEDDGDDENPDADRTLVGETPIKLGGPDKLRSIKKPSPSKMLSTFPVVRSSTPDTPLHTITLAMAAVEEYYGQRFAAIQQTTCKLVVKGWIKIIEPKKQTKYPYNKGEELKPLWWPDNVRHREPDHLSKTERITLLTAIVRSPLININRLELCTAEAGAYISRPRQAILREVYLVAKEEAKRRQENDFVSDLIVQLPNAPVSPSQVSPEGVEKRSYSTYASDAPAAHNVADKENANAAGTSYPSLAAKRSKSHHAARLAPLTTTVAAANYDPYSQLSASAYPSPNPWRPDMMGATTPHLSPYLSGADYWSNPASDYSRSPNPEGSDRYVMPHMYQHQHQIPQAQQAQHPHSHNQLAPIVASNGMTDSGMNAVPQQAGMAIMPAAQHGRASYPHAAYAEYLPVPMVGQPYADFGHASPYLNESVWELPTPPTTQQHAC